MTAVDQPLRRHKWRRTSAALDSDDRRYSLVVRERPDGRWSWHVVDGDGEISGTGNCRLEGGARSAARRVAKREGHEANAKFRRTSAELTSDCGNYDFRIYERTDGRWAWRMSDRQGKLVRDGDCSQEAGARASCRRELHRTRAMAKLLPQHVIRGQLSPELRQWMNDVQPELLP